MRIRTFAFFFCCLLTVFSAEAKPRNGADQLETLLPLLSEKRVSLVVNQTSLCGTVHLLDTLYQSGITIAQVFAPEHGFRGNAAPGETIKDGRDVRTGVPITSLYGKNKKPQPEQLNGTDIVVFDIQDVGSRFYTYISTLYYVMQACAENGKTVIVLDRPNPCDFIDGPILKPAYKSFVGMLPIPILHGCTIGEIARMINGEGWLGGELTCALKVIAVKNWKHGEPYSLPVKPSPNLPNDRSISLYASLCPFEGTDISVGRGTEYPFQIIGSPSLSSRSGFKFIPKALKGFDNNPLHKNKSCYGDDLRQGKTPEGFTLRYVIAYYRDYQRQQKEKDFFTRPKWFDLLMGTDQVRKGITNGLPEEEIKKQWTDELKTYRAMRNKYLIYPDNRY